MCKILPNLSCDRFDVSTTKVVLYSIEHFILIGLNILLLSLAIYNIWTILIKQKKYKTWPLLFFYIFTFITVALRIIWLIVKDIDSNVVDFIADCYLTSKLSVGLLQCWMILKIALRLRQTYKQVPSANFEKWLEYGQYTVITLSICLFVSMPLYDLCD